MKLIADGEDFYSLLVRSILLVNCSDSSALKAASLINLGISFKGAMNILF